ncbi:MAG TPA: pitrilysin family protein [Candidatus Dormibacteraeota bacterium]|nr:pitrilysin family protein [Candidatus Dormibacteraeota bacterium]
MVRRSALPNGLRIVTEPLDGVPSVTIGIWVESGSRFEPPHLGGISHFLEHLLFKGTERRTAAQIAEEMDAVGGVLNAFTGKEYTCYYARVLAEHATLAMDLLADLFLHSRLDAGEIDRERTVVLQEISQSEDTPDDYIHDLFNSHYWPGHPLGQPVCGTSATVQGLGRSQFVDFLAARYRPDRLIIAAAGNVTHEVIEAWAARDFSGLSGSASLVDGGPPAPRPGIAVTEKALEQVHLCLGVPGIAQGADERYAAYLLNTVLGGGMSSRLFQEIRERRGHAYSVYSFLSSYRDAGYVGIYVGTSAQWVEDVVTVIARELAAVARDGLRPDELARAKTQLKGNMLLGLETSDSRMSRVAKNEIYHQRDVSIAELSAGIDGVANDDIVALAAPLAHPERRALTLLGDLGGHALDPGILAA